MALIRKSSIVFFASRMSCNAASKPKSPVTKALRFFLCCRAEGNAACAVGLLLLEARVAPPSERVRTLATEYSRTLRGAPALPGDEPQTGWGATSAAACERPGATPLSMLLYPSWVYLAARCDVLNLPLASIRYGADRFSLVVSWLKLRRVT